ncbi:hypothetical protein DACRYDRAFT_108489 [Dacryopinax primogenitus]|uniref:F-box domain-containing protein n=1 Tax=Dacryopinax primogenitus (strain DJM 731) TaxID=1858805 RepID=M5GB27_DACPD|nr:uncharacterized protein DACRYDRAFT_108489 [Dacryopinax primogenitus]EJU01158.1 hypothetical protein DACRYDRAFT_108489 [Dacryopinax primogenitus]
MSRPKPTHRIFLLTELVHEIASNLHSNADKFHFAITSRAMWFLLCKSLWHTVNNEALCCILPEDLLSVRPKHRKILLRQLSADEQVRFRGYSSHIRDLRITDAFLSIRRTLKAQYWLPVLRFFDSTHIVFPKLRSLYLVFSHSTAFPMECMPLLELVDLQELAVHCCPRPDHISRALSVILALLKNIKNTTNIRMFSFSFLALLLLKAATPSLTRSLIALADGYPGCEYCC